MSRTEHLSRQRSRTAWGRAHYRKNPPARVHRRTERAEVDAEVADAELVQYDPEVLLWGGMLTTPQDVARRAKVREADWKMWARSGQHNWDGLYWTDMCDLSNEDWDSDAWDRDYEYERDMHRFDYDDSWYIDDERDAGWVSAWVDGHVHEPWSGDTYEHWYDPYYDDDDCWMDSHEDYPEPVGNHPGDLAQERERERQRASSRRKKTFRR